MKKDVTLPFGPEKANDLLEEHGSPLYVYDESGILKTAKQLNVAFEWANGYRNYFAVKATPTPAILKLLLGAGMGLDCSSKAELLMAQKLNVPGDRIFFTSNNTPKEDFELAVGLGAIVNVDDFSQVPAFIAALNSRHLPMAAARYNPGKLKSGNSIIGEPTDAKYGMDLDALTETFGLLKNQDIGAFGLHTMVASNELNPAYFAETAAILLDAVEHVENTVGIKFKFVNLGGGLGINYKTNEAAPDPADVSEGIKKEFEQRGRQDLRLFTEYGRFVTGPHGYLLTKVRYVMQKHKTYLGVDASMHNLMRPGMYGAYHHITVLKKDEVNEAQQYDVVGSLCENNDKFAIDRMLPQAKPGDLLVIHDAGAHGHAMGFNYNGLLKSAEILLKKDGAGELIRRAETPEDYFRTMVWPQQA